MHPRVAIPILVVVAHAAAAATSVHLSDCVKPAPVYPGMLRASEVCMRSMVPRTPSATSPHDTLQAIRDFHANRLEWTYGPTPEFIKQVQALGCTVSGAAANGNLDGVDRKLPDWFLAYSALDLNGGAVEAPWMRPWPGVALWHCINNPRAREAYLAYVKRLVDMGLRDLQRDDPTMNLNATNWGGCFCPHCMAGFRSFLQEHGDRAQLAKLGVTDLAQFDYAAYLRECKAPVGDDFAKMPLDYLKAQFIAFQEQSTIEFHRWWRAELDRHAGRHIAVSSNNGATDFGSIHGLFDFYVGELDYGMAQPEALYEAMSRARELGKAQNVTMPLRHEATVTPEWLRRIRQTIATCYALGMHIEAPWDTYLPIMSETPARFFGQPQDSADLYALVRACPELFDGYEEGAVAGGLLDEDPWTSLTRPVTVWADSDEVYAFARAVPGKPDAPVVVHLVDWSDAPRPFTVSLNPRSLFAGRPVELSLITPRPYDRAAHVAAEDSHNYGALVQKTLLARGPVTTCEIPALQPWGLLVITPLPETRQLWPPRLARLQNNGGDAVTAEALDAAVTIRFTTDGTDPRPTSAVLKGTVPLRGLKDFRARCYRAGTASPVARLAHVPQAGSAWRDLLVNADFAQGTTGWQPVTMGGIPIAALEFTTGLVPGLGGTKGAQLRVTQSDGVPYHVRLTQPAAIGAGQPVQLRATLVADRPTRVRIGLQEAREPFRVVGVRVLDVADKPVRVFISPTNGPNDLQAQFQLDLGYAAPGATVWLSGVQLRARVAIP